LEPEREPSSLSRSSLWPLALLCILSFVALFTSKRDQPRKPKYPQDTSENEGTGVPISAADIKADSIPTTYCKYEPDGSKNGAPWWEKAAAVAQVVIALVTVGLLIVNAFQMRANKKTADAAKGANKIAEGSLRPWVDAEVVKIGPITFDSTGEVLVTVAIKVTNVGHSPAVAVNIVPNVVNDKSIINIDQIQEKQCSQFKTDPIPETWGPSLFPTKDFTRTFGVTIPKVDVDKTVNVITPSIVGCVDYMLEPKGEHHQTNFFYTIIDEVTANGPVPIKKGRNVSSDKITFQRMFEMGNGAN
jgi:hypothetical protein